MSGEIDVLKGFDVWRQCFLISDRKMLVLSQINENFIVDLRIGLYQKIDQFTGILH